MTSAPEPRVGVNRRRKCHPDGRGEAAEEMSERGGELVTADEPTVVAEPLLDTIVVEDGQGDGSFPDPTCADESNGREVVYEINDLLDQLSTSKKVPRWWRW